MTQQKAFDKVWDHFIVKENPRCFTGVTCSYHDEATGNACAFGLLLSQSAREDLHRGGVIGISSDWYDKSSRIRATCSQETQNEVFQLLGDLGVEFCINLQDSHDRGVTVERLRNNLLSLASGYALAVPPH